MFVLMILIGAKWAWVDQNSNHEIRARAKSEQAYTRCNTYEQTKAPDVLRASLYIYNVPGSGVKKKKTGIDEYPFEWHSKKINQN